jgi:DNA-binding NtrC family response regulator
MPNLASRILLVGERQAPVASLAALLRDGEHEVVSVAGESPAQMAEAAARADVLIVAAEACADRCLTRLAAVRVAQPDLPIILIGRGCQVDAAVHALKLGMVDYLSRPVNPHKLREKVDDAIERRNCLTELARWRAQQPG